MFLGVARRLELSPCNTVVERISCISSQRPQRGCSKIRSCSQEDFLGACHAGPVYNAFSWEDPVIVAQSLTPASAPLTSPAWMEIRSCCVGLQKSEREKPPSGETNQHAPTQTPYGTCMATSQPSRLRSIISRSAATDSSRAGICDIVIGQIEISHARGIESDHGAGHRPAGPRQERACHLADDWPRVPEATLRLDGKVA